MTLNKVLWAALALATAGPVAAADPSQIAPGAAQAAPGGMAPGMGQDYRRDFGAPVMGYGYRHKLSAPGMGIGGQRDAGYAGTAPPTHPMSERQQTPGGPWSLQRPPGLGYPGHPARNPGADAPYTDPTRGYLRPQHRQGYGYPGYRGRGGSGYPGHRQYGNPPGVPAGPARTE